MLRRPEPVSGECELRSPGLGTITAHFRNKRKQHVLDLGSVKTPTIEFFSEHQYKPYVEQLASFLEALDAQNVAAEAGADHLLP